MQTPVVRPTLQLAIAKERERKLREQAGVTRLLKKAGSKGPGLRPSTLTLFSRLLTSPNRRWPI